MKSLINQLSKKVKLFLQKSQISDVILFGSAMRGKEEPNDIDILVVFTEKIDKDIEYELKECLSKINHTVSITSISEENLKKPTFPAREGYLFEGFSLVTKEPVVRQYGYASFGLFVTSTKDMKNKERTRYYYALNGRGGSKGFLDTVKGIRLSNDVFIVPIESIEPTKSFFEFWHMKNQYIPILIPERLGVKGILGKVI